MDTDRWLLWTDEAHAPTWNMSADETLLTTAREREVPLLRFYRWDRLSVTIGYVQTFDAVEKQGVEIVRRPTGGGVVDHEHDFTYSVAIPPHHWLAGVDRMESYGYINRAIGHGLFLCGFQPSMAENQIPRHIDRSRMVCFQQPTRYDVLANDQKVAGSAQRRTRDGILHQGSVLLNAVSAAVDREKLGAQIVTGFTETLQASFSVFTPDDTFISQVAAREKERYLTADWCQRRE